MQHDTRTVLATAAGALAAVAAAVAAVTLLGGQSSAGRPADAADGAPAATSGTATSPPTTAPTTTTATFPSTTSVPTTASATTEASGALPGTGATPAPAWLGSRVLPTDSRGFGIADRTPPELVDRRIISVDLLPPPADTLFHSSVAAVPAEVAARSTWRKACPVALSQLRYVTVTFRGFDGRAHTGELLLNRSAATGAVRAFRQLFALGYPIEEMRVTRQAELDAAPTGDGNNTSAFVCRPIVGSTSWSEHAYGRAIDVNPFLNPYIKNGLVIPELAVAYTDRRRGLPGMIVLGGPTVAAFADAGFGWGGNFRSFKDYQHFSTTGR